MQSINDTLFLKLTFVADHVERKYNYDVDDLWRQF